MTFKLALLQAGLFAASALILFVAVHASMSRFARESLHDSIKAEVATLAEERTTDGLADTIHTIELRSRDGVASGRTYLLLDADGRRLAGMMKPGMNGAGWQTLLPNPDAPGSADDETHRVEILGQRLPAGELLMVGRDTREVNEIEERLVRSFGIAGILTLLLAVLGGVVTGVAALRRVEAINATTRRIMQGDLTHRVALRGSEDEFDRLAANLNEMLDRIQHLMEGLRQVSSDIAHDLRTPLTHLRQRLEAARNGERSVEAYEAAIDATTGDSDRILGMFAALLRIAQIEAGTRRSGFGEVDLSAVFHVILDIYGPVAEDNRQTLVGDIAPGLRLHGDRELLTQMLANLVENAIRYGGQGAAIRLCLSQDPDGTLRATLTDTGPGIPSGLHDKVFRRFFRLAPDRGADGNGLGLSLVKAVVDLHDGEIRLVDNRPGLRVELALRDRIETDPRA